jgi:predicted dehydrogenase
VSRIALWLCGCALVVGCGPGTGPSSTLDQYGHALKDHDFGGAYDLMSASFRAKVSRQDYVRMMRDNPREVDETADRLRGHHGSLEVSANFEYGLGDQMRLVQEDGHWKISTNPLAFYDQSSPKAALRSFIRAYRLGRWDIMLRFVPDQYREKMDVAKLKAQFTGPSKDQMEALMNTLEANVDEPLVEKGNDARMQYGERYEVKFVKEDGVWKLKDLD